jgi:hypothetical protein
VAADNGNLIEVMFLLYAGIDRNVSGLPACSGS